VQSFSDPYGVKPDEGPTDSSANKAAEENYVGDQMGNAGSPQPTSPANPQYPNHETLPTITIPAGGGRPMARGRRKLWVGITAGVALAAGAVAVYVFGFYIPNLPENVWKSSLQQSSQAIGVATSRLTSQDMVSKYSKSSLDGSFNFSSADYTASGSASAKYDSTSAVADLTASLKTGTEAEKKLAASVILNQAKDKVYPTIYLRLSGLKSLGLDYFMPGLAGYDGKWIVMDEAYLKSIGSEPTTAQQASEQQITAQDLADAAKAVINTTTDYAFSTDPSKAVLEQKSFVGKEKVDGVDTYHYTVGINTEHARAYCVAVSNAYLQTNLAKKLTPSESDRSQQAKDDADGCKRDTTDQEIAKSKYDLWVNMRYKVVYKVRVAEAADTANYTDVGQNFDGSDTMHLFVNANSHQKVDDGGDCANCAQENGASNSGQTSAIYTTSSSKVTVDVNTSAATVVVNLSGNGDNGGANGKYTFKGAVSSKPYQGAIDTSKPSGATPMSEILKSLGLQDGLSSL
jgi:hypothetical protein